MEKNVRALEGETMDRRIEDLRNLNVKCTWGLGWGNGYKQEMRHFKQ